MVRQDERKAIPLSNITRIEKKKPISFIPGKGMSLEITEQGFDKVWKVMRDMHSDTEVSVVGDWNSKIL